MAFASLGLNPLVLKAVTELGYEVATPVQQNSVPILLEGHDLLAQAQTGTGKTAAFALPVLSKIDVTLMKPQVLVLAPTRELAIQVAEAFQSYAKHLKGFHVLPIYGGQDFVPQLRALKRGAHVVVGTPGRVMDHMRRETLVLDHIQTVVLDEADEMLNMGFQESVEWILQQMPHQYQMALFSATMPASIKKIANTYLKNPKEVKIQATKNVKSTITQYYVEVSRDHKLEALTRFLEVEAFEAAIIFTRTKVASSELAEKLEARGHSVAAINGDMPQNLREQVIKRMKSGTLDIIVATEVAARGLDVDRISYVINYDIPHDAESYVHRIGRTGRAGREGKSLVLVTPRERRMLVDLERATQQKITPLRIPTLSQIKEKRLEMLAEQVQHILLNEDLSEFRQAVQHWIKQSDCSPEDLAAALLGLVQKDQTLGVGAEDLNQQNSHRQRDRGDRNDRGDRSERAPRERREDRPRRSHRDEPETGMVTCRMEVGRDHDLKPGDVVGAIANMTGLGRKIVGQIQLFDDHTLVDIAEQHVQAVVDQLYRCKLKKRQTKITPV